MRKAGQRLSRREFLETAGRALAGGALGLLGLSLLLKSGPAAGRACDKDFYCRACGRTGSCPLPPALSFRAKFGGAAR